MLWPSMKSPFLQWQLQQNGINTNQSFSNKRNSIWTRAQIFVYKHIGTTFSSYQETPLVKILCIHFSNPDLPSDNKSHQQTASCKDPTLGSDPIYSSCSSNSVKTTWYYNEDKASLLAGANIFRHDFFFYMIMSLWIQIFCGSTQPSTFETSNWVPGGFCKSLTRLLKNKTQKAQKKLGISSVVRAS